MSRILCSNMPSAESLQIAVEYHQGGNLAAAERIYREILRVRPSDADVLHLLGVLEGQKKNFEEAVRLIRKSLVARPKFPEAYSNMGRLLLDAGKPAEAVEAYSQATRNSRDESMWYGLGVALRASGDDEGALRAYETTVQISPVFADAFSEIGSIRRKQGRLEEAVAAHTRAVQLRPDYPDGFSNLGNALVQIGRVSEAVQCYLKAIQLSPNNAVFHSNFGEALRKQENPEGALNAFNWAIKLQPGLPTAVIGRGTALCDMARFDEALQAHREAVALMPSNADAHEALGTTLSSKGDTVSAVLSFRNAVEVEPGEAPRWNRLGAALRALGEFEEAASCFRKALELKPGHAMSLKNLATNGKGSSESEMSRLVELVEDKTAIPVDRVAAAFALGKLFDDADRFDEAFAQYAWANTSYRDLRAAERTVFSPEALRQQVTETIKASTFSFFKSRHDWGDTNEVPVFIVGMPRSGTTLVEQIAASHSEIYGAGELPEMSLYSITMGADPEKWSASQIRQAAMAHVERLRSLNSTARRVIDKTPGNVLCLGLIAVLFPNARIIFCQRDPRDNCLSCYFQWFAKNNLMFSYDLEDCAVQYMEQQRLTAHWLKVLPLRMMTVQYEEMVADLEGQSKRLIDFLGVPWEEGCLNFHQTKRTVLTASVWQVRQPIYNSSVGRWRHYEKHLGPLLRKLQM